MNLIQHRTQNSMNLTEQDLSGAIGNADTAAFIHLTTSMSQEEDGDEATVKASLGTAHITTNTPVLQDDVGSFDEDVLPALHHAAGSVPAENDPHPSSSFSMVQSDNVALSVTPQRKDELLLEARSDRLRWIQRVPLPYRTKESGSNHRFFRFLHYSHATQHMPSAARVLEYLYGHEPDRVDALLEKRFESQTDLIPRTDGTIDEQLVHLTGNQILETEINSSTDVETTSVLKNYQAFQQRLQDPECALVVQGMRTFFRTLPDCPDASTAISKLKEYRVAMVETMKQNTVFKGMDANLLRRALESFLFGQARSHLDSLLWTIELSKVDESFRDKLQALQFVTPTHLDIHCLVAIDLDADHLKGMLAEPVKALQSIDAYHSAYEKLQRILVVYKSVSSALTEALQQNPATANKLPSADDVLPTIILSVLMALPVRLAFNLRLVEELCSPEDLRGEAGYAFANLYGAHQFLADLDLDKEPSSLSISKEAFREAMDSNRATVEERRRSLDKPIVPCSDAESNANDTGSSMISFPSPNDVRLARMQGETVDLGWALRLQEGNGRTQSEASMPTNSALPRSAIEMAEHGLPAGFRRNYSFLTARSEDIRVHDLPKLLDEYRMLVHASESLLGERVLKHAAERKASARSVEKNLMMAARSIDPNGDNKYL
jgi:Vacuolar sorting protein 9 (VPS9) domain